MPARIRLQRKGKKGQPFYQIVIADGRAPRDGKYIERIGTYNPLTIPAEITIDDERAIYWLQAGAQPTDTVRNILSYKGVLLKNHLQIGVKKGAITQAVADNRYNEWLQAKEAKIAAIAKKKEASDRNVQKTRLEEEKKVNEARAEVLAKKAAEEAAKKAAELAAAQAEQEAAAAAEAAAAEVATAETPAEPVAETPAEPVAETPAEANA